MDHPLAFSDLLIVLFPVVVDGDQLHEEFLGEKDSSDNNASKEDFTDCSWPAMTRIRCKDYVVWVRHSITIGRCIPHAAFVVVEHSNDL